MTQPVIRSTIAALYVASVVTLATASSAQVQQPPMMSMTDMMMQCGEHSRIASTAIDRTLASVREARQSRDAGRMRAALDEAEKPLTEMREHMSACMNMTGMMQQMHGGGGRGGMVMIGGTSSGDRPAATPGDSAMQGMQGMACCMPGQGLHGTTGAVILGIGALLALSLSGALFALAVFLWNRSRIARTT